MPETRKHLVRSRRESWSKSKRKRIDESWGRKKSEYSSTSGNCSDNQRDFPSDVTESSP